MRKAKAADLYALDFGSFFPPGAGNWVWRQSSRLRRSWLERHSGTNACLKLDGARGKPPCLFFRVLSPLPPALPAQPASAGAGAARCVAAAGAPQEASSNLCNESTLNTLGGQPVSSTVFLHQQRSTRTSHLTSSLFSLTLFHSRPSATLHR